MYINIAQNKHEVLSMWELSFRLLLDYETQCYVRQHCSKTHPVCGALKKQFLANAVGEDLRITLTLWVYM